MYYLYICIHVYVCFVLRDARSPANDAVTYAILHNKHKITYIHAYIQMRVCVRVFGALMQQLLLLLLFIWPYL